jgi:hypothetical protein
MSYTAENQNKKRQAGKTTATTQYTLGYDAGYFQRYRCGLEDGWVRGFTAKTRGDPKLRI